MYTNFIIMPKIYSNDFKSAVLNFYFSDLFTLSNTISIFNISKSTLYNWVNSFQKFKTIFKSNIRPKYNSKITNEIQNFIVTCVIKKSIFTIKNLKRRIFKIFSVHISKSSIYRILKINNITHKKINNKFVPNKQNTKKLVTNFLNTIKSYDSDKIISIDESSFDTNLRPIYGWNKKGRPLKKIIKCPRKKRKTLTLAVSNNKIIGYSLVNGASNNIIFKKFLQTQVLPKIKNSVILMDNVKFHHSKNVIDLVNSTNNHILYNVPYNPDTNPVELVFSIIKNFVRHSIVDSNNSLDKSILNSFKLITPSKLKNIFNHSFDY